MLHRKPRIGDRILFPGRKTVRVHHFGTGHRETICYYSVDGHNGPREGTDCFIWSFSDGLNREAINLDEAEYAND